MAEELTRVPVVDDQPAQDIDIVIGPGMLKNFDPRKHLMKIGPKDYLQVMYRLVWLRDIDPAARVTTKLEIHEGDLAVFKAEVQMSEAAGGGYSVAHGSETKGDFRDYIEKAETKAIGRALANLGFGTQFTGFELDTNIVDSPVDFRPLSGQGGQSGRSQASPANNRPNNAQTGTQAQVQPPAKKARWDQDYVCDIRPPDHTQKERWDAVIDASIDEVDLETKKRNWAALRGYAILCCNTSPRNNADGVPEQNWRWYRIVSNAPTINYLRAIETAIEETAAWDDHLMQLAKARAEDLVKKDFDPKKATFLPQEDVAIPELPY